MPGHISLEQLKVNVGNRELPHGSSAAMSRAARNAPIRRLLTTPAETGTDRKCQGARLRMARRARGHLMLVNYYHVGFTLPAPMTTFAYRTGAVTI